jgi:hypothetical protein
VKFTKTTLIICFSVLTILLARKSDIFGLGFDIEKFVKVVPLWFLSAFILLVALQFYLKKKYSENTKLAYWSLICIFSLFHWCAVKADTTSYEPRDISLDMKPRFEETLDSSELQNQEIYSTIQYVHSIDTTKEGVFVRVNAKTVLLRKLTDEEKKGGEMRSDLDKQAVDSLQKIISPRK